MDVIFGERNINFRAVSDFSHLERSVQQHLKNVYSCLAISMMAAAAGAYVHLFTNFFQGGFLTSIIGIGLLIWLAMERHESKNTPKRLAILGCFAFCTGISLGPLLDHVVSIDPSIIATAFLGTTVIFLSFSLAALFNTNRAFLFLGGSLISALSWLLLFSLANIFIGSKLIYDLSLYAGLLIFCGFVLFDTQLIIEKRRNGDTDFVWHSVDLFLDFINIFRRLMMILSNKEKKRRN